MCFTSFLWEKISLSVTAVLITGVGSPPGLPEQNTHEGNARQSDRDRRLETRKDCGEHTVVRHIRKV